ncbi:prolyl 4-hydroxylase subunit alpha-2 [Drosophila eugracilis]|uniref:prolyl 4-hydroxylase subunit alpha-2 n=1 Tax=Drosophila eugracilis TaxID=29029 RepID=UPI001BDAA150|nr:prolyl 4-hydroxylase subunit alpha-2 [Drosophila eugracilis]
MWLKLTFMLGLSWLVQGYVDRKNYVTSSEEKLNLLAKDKELIIQLNSYAMELQDKIDALRGIAKAFKKPLEEAKNREDEYLSNPFMSLTLIRQMREDWEPLEKFMQKPVGLDKIASIEELRKDLPLQDDLTEASLAMFRIIQTYGLEPRDVARGLVDGVQYSGSLSASDCYAMGKGSFKMGSYLLASKWLRLAKKLLAEQPRKYHEVIGVSDIDVTLLLARSLVASGEESNARDILMKDSRFGGAGNALALHFLKNPQESTPDFDSSEAEESFNHLCRSVSRRQANESTSSRLHCRYNTTTSPFLKLAPFRMEELSLNPYIVIYHSVLSDSEIESLESKSRPFLERAMVFHAENGTEKVAPSRTADSVWLPYPEADPEDQRLLDRISRKTEDITGLRLQSGREMQFLKYGFGGHFVPHHDYFSTPSPFLQRAGDRIATLIFYLNNVQHGGATAFPQLNLVVPTQKGSALFWHNLDGETYDFDQRTFHGACPLISGHKIVMTRWIHELDQMFLLPAMLPPRNRNFSRTFSY